MVDEIELDDEDDVDEDDEVDEDESTRSRPIDEPVVEVVAARRPSASSSRGQSARRRFPI